MNKSSLLNLVLFCQFLSFLFFHCTGINVGVVMYSSVINTNPTPEYGTLQASMRGGGVYHKNSIPGQLGNNVGEKLLVGESCSQSALWLVSWGDSTIETAKEKAGIQKVASVEYMNRSILGFLYHKFCTKVIGSE